MKNIARILVLGWLAAAPSSYGSIEGFKQLSVDFTNPADATNKAAWSEPERLTLSREGLGWDGEAASCRNGWIQTKPLAVGLSWRPPIGIYVRVVIQPAPREITLANGQKTTPYTGDTYVRYSPDLRHWSSWQSLQRAEPQTVEEKKQPGRRYSATISIPHRERAGYDKLLREYSTLDVPWKSDEEAAVRWILSREPDFFSRQIPFIGYVEFLFEGCFYGGGRIRSFKAEISYGMSGLHTLPRDEAVYTNRDFSPWRFEASPDPDNSRH